MTKPTDDMGTAPIPSLLVKQAVPASIGILIMSIYGIVDTIFVGRYVGALGIAAITVVLPITFLISSIGMAIGVGGASIISRALGSNSTAKAWLTFGNQVTLTIVLASFIVVGGFAYQDEILIAFGGRGDILPYAKTYFHIMLYGIPFLAWAMMSNNVIRAEGKPRIAMYIMVVPAVVNMILDPILIITFDMGIAGAAWATTVSYVASAGYAVWFFASGRTSLRIGWMHLRVQWTIVQEIFAIGIISLARQGTVSVLSIILNNALFRYGGEMSLSVYGVINRVMMFANFPVLGITQGYLPIAGYNYGAEQWPRVRQTLNLAIRSGTAIALVIFAGIMVFSESMAGIFTHDAALITATGPALRIVFAATPLIAVQLMGSGYFQAIGKPLPGLLLTLTKQGFCLIPLLLILPRFMGLAGIWYAFPIADVVSAAITYYFLWRGTAELRRH